MDTKDSVECCGGACKNCVLNNPEILKSPENDQNATNVIDKEIFRQFSLIDIKEYQINIYWFTLEYVNENKDTEKSYILDIQPGQHVLLRGLKKYDVTKFNTIYNRYRTSIKANNIVEFKEIPCIKKRLHNENIDYVIRPYSPIMIEKKKLIFHLLLKLMPEGSMSNYLQSLNIGDRVDVAGPFGDFKYTPNLYRNIVCFSQGISLAPIFCVLNAILNDKEEESRITFYPCFFDLENIYLRNELYNLNKYWNFKSIIFLAKEKKDLFSFDKNKQLNLKYNEIVRKGYLNLDTIKELFEEGKFKPNSTLVLLSGSENFINLIKTCIKKLDFTNYHEF